MKERKYNYTGLLLEEIWYITWLLCTYADEKEVKFDSVLTLRSGVNIDNISQYTG